MITKQGKKQIYFGSFLAATNEEIFVAVPNGDNPPMRLSFKYVHPDQESFTSSVAWKTQDGIARFTVYGFQRGAEGFGSTPLAEIGTTGDGNALFLQIVFGTAGGDSKLVSIYLYEGGIDA